MSALNRKLRMRKRYYDLDVIKVVASIMVIMLHIGNVYMRSDYFGGVQLYHYTGMFFSVFCRTAVPLFVMTSGFLYFDNESNANYKKYYIKTVKRIILPTIGISLFYILVQAVRELVIDGTISWMTYLNNAISGNAYSHLWYMYMICGLYIVAPLLYVLKERIEKHIWIWSVSFMAKGGVLALLFDLPWPLQFLQYIGYFILGWAVKLNSSKFLKYKYIELALSLLIMIGAFVVTVWQEIMDFHTNLQVYKYLSPVTIVASTLLFAYFTSIDVEHNSEVLLNRISKLSSNNMIIYFVHQLYIDILYHWILRENAIVLFPIIAIPVLAVVIYFLSYGTSIGAKKIGSMVPSRKSV